MKIVHLADTHLGYRALPGIQDPNEGINQRQADVFQTWREAIEKAVELKPDAVIHAGDLFDSSRPAPRSLAEALDGFALLRDAGIPAVVIAGNHEAPRFRSGGSVFQILERFGVRAIWREPETVPRKRTGDPRRPTRARCQAASRRHRLAGPRPQGRREPPRPSRRSRGASTSALPGGERDHPRSRGTRPPRLRLHRDGSICTPTACRR